MRLRSLRAAAAAFRDALTPDRAPESDRELVLSPDPLDERDVTPPAATPHAVQHVPSDEQVSRNTLEVLAFRALGTPLTFGLVVLQSRFLDPAGRGSYVIAVLGVTLITRLLGDLGTAATNQIGQDRSSFAPWTSTALRASFVFGLAGTLFLVASHEVVDVPQRLALLTGLAVTPALVTRSLSAVLLGVSRVRIWSVIQVLPSAISLGGFLLLVIWLDRGIEGAIVAYVAGHVVAAAVALVATYRLWAGWLLRHVPWRYVGRLVRLAVAMGLVNFLVLVNYRVELILLKRERGEAAAGIYANATTVAESLWLITTAIATGIWAPVLHESEERAAGLVTRSAVKSLLFLLLAAGVVAVIAPYLIPLAFGEKFEPSVTPLLYLLPGIVVYGPVQVLTTYVSVRRGRPGYAVVGPASSLAITTGLALLLIPEHGPTGAAIACTVGYAVGALGVWVMFARLAGRMPRLGNGRAPAS